MFYFARISQEYADLAIKEIEVLSQGKIDFIDGEWIRFQNNDSIDLKLLKRISLTKEIYEVLDIKQTFEEICEALKEKLKFVNESFKVTIFSKDKKINYKNITEKIYFSILNPKVKIENPKFVISVLFLNEVYLLNKLCSNEDKPKSRRSHLLPYNHPTTMDPKLAKALINILGPNVTSIHDPCCGVGGIILEAGLLGLKISGGDISKELVMKAKENLEKFNLKCELYIEDALTNTRKSDAIITDLPYGKNSTITEKKEEFTIKFLKNSLQNTNKILLGTRDVELIEKASNELKFKIEFKTKVYIHKSMTRYFFLITK